MHFLLFYELAPDYLERRVALREEHLALGWAAVERGELVLAGALSDPVDQAVLLFNVASEAPIRAFVQADPYVREGLVLRWSIRPWTTAIGETAATPIRPTPR